MRIYVFMMALLLLCSPALQAATVEQQRGWFKQARIALNQQQMKHFYALKDKLEDYPLTPYLDIWHASKKLKQGDDSLVAATLLAYADVPETIDLRRHWLKYLAKKGFWVDVHYLLEKSPKLAAQFPETAMLMDWNTGRESAAIVQFSKRWQQGKAFSSKANGLYHAWQKLGHPTEVERWQRISVFAKKRKWTKVRDLAQSLPKQEKSWLSYWKALQKDPERALQPWPKLLLQSQSEFMLPAKLMMDDIMHRLSRRDVEKAWKALHQLQAGLRLNTNMHEKYQDDRPYFFAQLERDIALRAARQHQQVALAWLMHLPKAVQNKDTRGWQVRLAVLAKKWPAVLDAVASMPLDEAQLDRWQYWQARAWDVLGDHIKAKQQFSKLAVGRGYYNFLSAELLDQPFRFEAATIHASDQLLAEVEAIPAVVRAAEWLALDMKSKASREWHFGLAGVDVEHWKAAAVLALQWHWDDQVIRAAFKADEMNALVARFPMSYKKVVQQEAKRTGLMPAMIWSIIRQESAFNQYAVSYVGAKGLMQLMPATARHVARQLKMKTMGKGTPRLFSAATNIRLGSKYLADVNQRFGSLALAAAGYNAGPHRVATWLERASFQSPEAWVEAIPFDETRRYVQQVMAFVSVYEWRQHKKPTSMLARMRSSVQKVSFNQALLVQKVQLK